MSGYWHGLLADAVVILHLLFILFTLTGGWLALRWIWIVWVHLPAVLWASVVEFSGWICPLTPLENMLRYRSGGSTYSGDFVQHYLLPLLYPAGLTRGLQIALGTLVLAVNLIAYGCLLYRRWRPKQLPRRIPD